MDENFKKQLKDCGADVETTVKRFMGNEALYEKFVMKFLDDKNCEGIQANIEKSDYKEVFNCAHALKGVSANLGLDPITAIAAELCDLLRNKQAEDVDAGKVDELGAKLTEVCGRIRKILEENKH
jgi:HPt (histidine-containing phosphotransfer) domain-containing protein